MFKKNEKKDKDIEIKTERKRNSIIPGFRTGKLWKKIIAVVGYIVLLVILLALLIPTGYGNGAKDVAADMFSGLMGFVMIAAYLAIIFNFAGIRNKLPIFRKKGVKNTVLGFVIAFFVIGIGCGLAIGGIDSLHSEDYFIAKAQAVEKAELQRQIALVEKEKAEAEEKVIKEAEKAAKEEAKEKAIEEEAKKRAQEKTKKETEKYQKKAERAKRREERKAAREKRRAERQEARAKKRAEKEAAKAQEKADAEAAKKAEEQAQADQKKNEETMAKQKEEEAQKAAQELARQKEDVKKQLKTELSKNLLSKDYPIMEIFAYDLKVHDFSEECAKVDPLVKNADLNTAVYLEEEGFLNRHYKRTKNYSEYLYVGEMNDNQPQGLGVIFKEVYAGFDEEGVHFEEGYGNTMYFTPIYAGEFKNGQYDGFGYKFAYPEQYLKDYTMELPNGKDTSEVDVQKIIWDYTPIVYEGYFSGGEYEGKGTEYYYGLLLDYDIYTENDFWDEVASKQYFSMADNPDEVSEEEWLAMAEDVTNKSTDLYMFVNIASGTYKNGRADGEFNLYADQYLIYSGGIKNWKKSGEGISYFYGTEQKQYEGEWSAGEYDGEGTEYDEQGNILYSGKWRSGDYDD